MMSTIISTSRIRNQKFRMTRKLTMVKHNRVISYFNFSRQIFPLENWDEYTGQEGDEEPSTSSKHLGDEPHCEDPDFIVS